ncbi:DUF2625 family protein [Streptomyces sp. NPDC048411]|uniref:DUF2625 family protein n=1 Tax=Streptomyces sp. NPDC048411 TaxID=3157206 RepID=UPI0034547A9E
MNVRPLAELTRVDDPAWPVLQELFRSSPSRPEVLSADADRSLAGLEQLQVTTRSFLGSMVVNCGGLLLDGGWLRVFGGVGSRRMPGLAEVNGFPPAVDPAWRPAGGLVVAHDILGGVFVLNGSDAAELGRPGEPGQMIYFAPDTMEWEPLEAGYAAWLEWLLSGALDQFYEGLRWPGWREEITGLPSTVGIAVFPFLWSAEAQNDLAATHRKPVPMSELLGLRTEFGLQLGSGDPGFLGNPGTADM